MNADNKTAALEKLRREGIPLLPSAIVPLASRSNLRRTIESQWSFPGRVIVRASGKSHDKNLPRLVAVAIDDAIGWIERLPQTVSEVVISPFGRVQLSAELQIRPENRQISGEVLPGIWETDAKAVPTRLLLDIERQNLKVVSPHGAQEVRFVEPDGSTAWRFAPVHDWQVARVAEWAMEYSDKLFAVSDRDLDRLSVLRLHDVDGYGLVAQNLRSDVAASLLIEDAQPQHELQVVRTLEIPMHPDEVVALDVSVAREGAFLLRKFFNDLRDAGVAEVRLRSGLLSHVAIIARECGLRTGRASADLC